MITKHTEDLCLVVTERCNLNCCYCQSDKSFKRTMTWECAKKQIDTFLSLCEVEAPSITFMGGEPFMAFELIKKVVNYAKRNFPNIPLNYTIITNGTLVQEHEDTVQVVLSLDGLGEEHDMNRCHSLKMIDLNFFHSLRKPIVNTVFTPDTIKNMSQTTIQLHKNGFYVKGFIADGVVWESSHTTIIGEQLMELISYYMQHPNIPPISLLGQPLYYLTLDKSIRRCGTEKCEEISVSTDGKLWACHRCTPFENHGTWKIPKKYIGLTNARHLLIDCNNCFLEKICNACPASNAAIKDNEKLSATMCSIRKLLFKANAYFALSMLASETDYVAMRSLSNEKKFHLSESAKTILEKL